MATMAPGRQVPVPRGADAPADRRWPARVAVGLAVLGLGYRVAMLLGGAPPTNSDEATMGLAALHIAEGRQWPVFFYGQHYMGTLEAYLAAPLFLLFGASTLVLRLPALPMYALFLAVMWRLTARLYSPWLATFTVGLLALGSDRILRNQLVAGGGYPEMNPAGALLLLLAVNLGLGRAGNRLLSYGGWGLVAGLMVWDDWLLLPYVAAAGVLLLAVPGRRPTWRETGALVAGGLLGAAPLLAHNLTAPFGQNSVAVFLTLNGGSGGTTLGERLYGAVLYGLPMGTGLCPPKGCATWQLWWGWTYPVLLAVAGVLAVLGLRRLRGTGRGAVDRGGADRDGVDRGAVDRGGVERGGVEWSANPSARFVRQAGRLALVVAAGLTVLAYLRSGPAAATPVESSRYLSCLLISTPAVLWPLWSLAGRHRPGPGPLRAAAVVPLAALVATMLLATAAVVADVPHTRRLADQRAELVTELRRLGINRFYSEYWTCLAVTFASREELVCAVIGDDLRPGLDRYLPYREQVRAASLPAYVLPGGSPLSAELAVRLRAADPGATLTAVAGYDIYRPSRPVGLPLR